MRIAAYQAPLLRTDVVSAVDRIRVQVARCEAEGVAILCCPEAILGGLADGSEQPARFAINIDTLDSVLAPLASNRVTTIVGFTEAARGRLYNAAAVFHRGSVIGVYRKMHPAIRRSFYDPGTDLPVFQIGSLTFGVVICNDSNHPELANRLGVMSATALFVPTNNALPPAKGGAVLVDVARNVDIATARANAMWVVRADVAGRSDGLESYGSSAIVNPEGVIVSVGGPLREDLLIVEIAAERWPADHGV